MKYVTLQKHILNEVVIFRCLTENALLVAGMIEQAHP